MPRSGEFDIARLLPLMETLDRASHGGRTQVEQAARFYELLSCLYQGGTEQSAASRAADYLARSFAQRITLDQLCDELHFSKNHVINLFRREYGMTPFEYLNRLRVQEAIRLLEVTALPVSRIAELCGFSDYSAFYKLFRKHTGCAPSLYRTGDIN